MFTLTQIQTPLLPLRSLHPGYFAMVMASGIIAVGFEGIAQPQLAQLFTLFGIGVLSGLLYHPHHKSSRT
ncbi:hypothetical protein D5085_01395 [Ectothiorhodospiraceae bacterium BW-2]|nr:hypothetical protein D5085_01395 [Ectothiorhodospiraceae bacterium BW-2]